MTVSLFDKALQFSSKLRAQVTVVRFGSAALFFLGLLCYALSRAVYTPNFHLDGAFQTASGLFRLSAGQLPGKHFFPYLGVGPLLSLYPAFMALGSNLAASVFAAHFMIALFFWLAASILWHLVFGPRSFLASIVAAAAFFLAPKLIASHYPLSLPTWLEWAFDPGYSLRPVRASAPYLVALTYYLLVARLQSARLRSALSGVVTGSILLWSNDYAIPCAGLFAAFFVLKSFKDARRASPPDILVFLACALASWVLLLSLVTCGHALNLLQYNFRDVARDQWWFFAPYGESTRIFEPRQIFRLISWENSFALKILALTAVAAAISRKLEHVLFAWIGVVLFAGGALASVGGHLGGYFEAFNCWGRITVILVALKSAQFALEHLANWSVIATPALFEGCFSLLAFSLALASAASGYSNYKATLRSARNDPQRFLVPELGGYLPVEYRAYIDLMRQTNSSQVVEEYWGIWSAARRILPRSPVDAAIHALGRTRAVAAQALAGAEIIISTRFSTSPDWQPWNLSQNYWLYDELFRNWTPREISPTTVVWHRNDKASKPEHSIECRTAAEKTWINLNFTKAGMVELPGAKAGLYSMRIKYRFSGKGRHLLLVQNNLSFAADAGGCVSIDPSAQEATFPVYIPDPRENSLALRVVGSDEYQLSIESCTARPIPFEHDEVLRVPGGADETFFLTDDNWSRGVARRWAGFFVPNDARHREQYRPGRFVMFSNGHTRRITKLQLSGPYLNVFLEGRPITPEDAGLPSSYAVSDKGEERSDG